ncbi:MAG TPA: hypothetical protein VN651_04775, partial [Gemmatimonadaceae bacterium]|nr:hypothetical protein [Gemmatimonadaceae bacterium]
AVTDYGDGPMVMPAKFRADKAAGWNTPVRKPRRHVVKKSSRSTHAKASTSRSTSKKSSAKKSSR